VAYASHEPGKQRRIQVLSFVVPVVHSPTLSALADLVVQHTIFRKPLRHLVRSTGSGRSPLMTTGAGNMGTQMQGNRPTSADRLADLLRRLFGFPPKPVLAPVPVRGGQRR
jgi:hypothetical protein